MSPTPPNGVEAEQSILQRIATFFREQLASIQSNVSLTRNSLMSQRTGGVATILAGVPARGVTSLGLLPILRRPTPTEPPAGPPPAVPLVGPPIPPVTPEPTGDISQEFTAI